MKKLNLIGEKYNMLTPIKQSGMKGNLIAWECLCDCGNYAIVTTKNLRNGGTKSCGCLHSKHAMQMVKNNTRPIGFKRIKKCNGRVEIKTENGFVFEHVAIMESILGRKLKKGEVVHHIDHDKTNNDPNNLMVMTNAEHTAFHSKGRFVSKFTRDAISDANKKYTKEQAAELRRLISSGLTQNQAAVKLGMSKMTASRIARNLIYKEADDDRRK